MKRLLMLAVLVTAVSQVEAINTQGGIRTAASIRSYCHKNHMNYQASPQGGYCVKARLLGSPVSNQVVPSKRNIGGNPATYAPMYGKNPATWSPQPKLGPAGVQRQLGPDGKQQMFGGNPATWSPRMTGNQGGSY